MTVPCLWHGKGGTVYMSTRCSHSLSSKRERNSAHKTWNLSEQDPLSNNRISESRPSVQCGATKGRPMKECGVTEDRYIVQCGVYDGKYIGQWSSSGQHMV